MMRWLKRSFWIALWALWVYAGFGLYRELPRQIRPTVATIPCSNARVFGFVGNTNRIAVEKCDGKRTTNIELYDAETGARIYSRYAGNPQDHVDAFYDPRRRPCVVAKQFLDEMQHAPVPGLHVFDLHSGEWSRLGEHLVCECAVHPYEPIVACVEERGGTMHAPRSLVLVDWVSKKRTVVCEEGTRGTIGKIYFASAGKRLLVSRSASNRTPIERTIESTEIWVLDTAPRLEKTVEGFTIANYPSWSDGARVAFADPHGSDAVEVYDFMTGRGLFAKGHEGEPTPPMYSRANSPRTPCLSKSGRMLLGGYPGKLWTLDTGKVVWQGHSIMYTPEPSTDMFLELESWHRFWVRWFPQANFSTLAIRDLETGALVERCDQRYGFVLPRHWNTDRTLAVSLFGTVHRLPLAVDWPLLGGCQTVLATPIVLLWSLLRWRRRRRPADGESSRMPNTARA